MPKYGDYSPIDPATGAEIFLVKQGVNTRRMTLGQANVRALAAALGIGYVIGRSIGFQSHTGDTLETTLATVQIPANALGINGFLRIRTDWEFVGTAGNKGPRIYFGGTLFGGSANQIAATNLRFSHELLIKNVNATNVQRSNGQLTSAPWTNGGLGVSALANVAGAIDTTLNQDVAFTMQLANAADVGSVSYIIEIFPKD